MSSTTDDKLVIRAIMQTCFDKRWPKTRINDEILRFSPNWRDSDYIDALWAKLCSGQRIISYEGFDSKDAETGGNPGDPGNSSFNTLFVYSSVWPTLDASAYHGLAGDVVHAIEPYSESDPVMLLVQFLVAFGNKIGRSAHFTVESTKHFTNEFAVFVGDTAKARKGTSWGRIKHLLSTAADIHDPTDYDVWSSRIWPSVSSGEAIVSQVSDNVGLADKRLMLVDEEFSQTCTVMMRQGNTISPTLREAWDGKDLAVLTKDDSLRATGAHVSLIGHITIGELQATLSEVSLINGFANRILWVLAQRSKYLPFGGDNLDEHIMKTMIDRISKAILFATEATEVIMTQETREIWQEIYKELSEGKPGIFGNVTARAEAHCRRFAIIFALLDLKTVVEPEHLYAALAIWKYAESSVRYMWGDLTGLPIADAILKALRIAGEKGMSRTEINALFRRNQTSERIVSALSMLQQYRLATCKPCVITGSRGRPSEIWFAS
jgi:hypothetical protein